MAVQPGTAGCLELNLGVEQRHELGHVASLVVELDPSPCDCELVLHHCALSPARRAPGYQVGAYARWSMTCSGRNPGFASDLFHLPKKRMTIAVAVDDEGWPLEDTTAELMYAALEREAQ